jgi:hypothetical protein
MIAADCLPWGLCYNIRDVAALVDQVARLGNTGEIPMRTPSHFHTAVNLKTAKSLGLQLHDRLLALADEVIE